eukprot:1148910-Pelagomonas_calceolata.AAC.5
MHQNSSARTNFCPASGRCHLEALSHVRRFWAVPAFAPFVIAISGSKRFGDASKCQLWLQLSHGPTAGDSGSQGVTKKKQRTFARVTFPEQGTWGVPGIFLTQCNGLIGHLSVQGVEQLKHSWPLFLASK